MPDERPKLPELFRKIVPKYAARWKDLGVQLGIPIYHLDAIEEDNANRQSFTQQCCKAMLRKWMESTPDPTWNILQKAIDCLCDLSDDGSSESMS